MATVPTHQAVDDDPSWPSPSSAGFSHDDQDNRVSDKDGSAYNVLAGSSPGYGMTLLKRLHGFVLAGNHEPLLHEINGGRYCVDPTGIQPPGWRLHGSSLDLETCARIANAQKHVVGFKWGSEKYNYSAYMSIVGSELHMPRTPVQLSQLYREDTEFKCEVFMVDQWGNVPEISLKNFSDLKNSTVVRARRLMAHHAAAHHVVHHAAHHAVHHSMHSRLHHSHLTHGHIRGAKKQEFHVCLQKRALGKFVNTNVPEFWFCYLPEQQWAKCETDMRNYILQGVAVVVGGIVVIVPLSYIMQNQIFFTWSVVWVTRLVMSLELSVWSIWYLLQLGISNNVPALGLSFLALLLVIVGNTLVLLPYECCKACASCPVSAIVYLLCLVTCPVLFLNWATYISPFIELVSYSPVPVGLLGFTIELIKHYLCPNILERVMGRVISLPEADDSGSFFSSKRHMMTFPSAELMGTQSPRLPQWGSDAEDMDAKMVASAGCCSALWRKRVPFFCRPMGSAKAQTPRHHVDPTYGMYHESADHLPVWSGDGEHAPL